MMDLCPVPACAAGSRRPVAWPTAGFALLVALVLAATPALGAVQPAPRPDPSEDLLGRSVEGLLPDSLRTEVLVLGSTHLQRYAERFRPEMLDGLVSALEAWKPDAVGVERLPPGYYRAIGADDEPEVGRTMQEALDVEMGRAVVVSDSLLAAVEAGGDPPSRVRLDLIGYLVAAHRLPTATLHWMELDRPARTGADLPAGVREALERRAAGPANETYSIGLRLAREGGLSRLHPIDDRTSDRVFDLEGAVAEGLRDHLAGHPRYARVQEYIRSGRRRVRKAMGAGDLLPYYRWKNAPKTVERDVRLQWGIFLELAEKTPLAQKRLAHWEIRNLKMVRHIREMTLHHPGGRVVVVVGGGHKAFFDDYLDRMLDVDVVQLAEVL